MGSMRTRFRTVGLMNHDVNDVIAHHEMMLWCSSIRGENSCINTILVQEDADALCPVHSWVLEVLLPRNEQDIVHSDTVSGGSEAEVTPNRLRDDVHCGLPGRCWAEVTPNRLRDDVSS